MKRPIIFIISGPSGAGKTTLINSLFRKQFVRENFLLSVSFTTRRKRPGEKEGRDYFFVEHGRFQQLITKKFFVEHEKVLDIAALVLAGLIVILLLLPALCY